MSAATAAVSPAREARPTPEAIDQLCSEYCGLKEKLLTASNRAAEISGELETKP